MLRYTYKIVLRRDFVKKDGTSALMLQAFVGGQRVRLQLDLYVKPEEYDEARMEARIPKDRERQQQINAVLMKLKGRVEAIFYEARMGNPISGDAFKEELDDKPALGSFIAFMEFEREKEKGDKAVGTIKTYTTVIGWLRKFRNDVAFSDISFDFVQEFDRYLKKNKVDVNGRAKYHRVIRKFVLLAKRKGRRVKNPYEHDFKIRDVAVERVWLSVDEVDALVRLYREKSLGNNLQCTLRHFLFQVVTSVRVSDLLRLEKSDREGDMLVFKPEKTKRLRKIVKVPLSDLAKELIRDSESRGEKLFDVPTEQTMNGRLKEIAAAAGIKKKVTTHVGRHTFGFLYLLMGGKVEELREILGHSKIETTMVYTHTDYERKVAGVKKFDEIFRTK
jgi:integrase/recombinase XerD